VSTIAKPSSTKARRRTQAERSAATRAALLDATIECLVDEGYADTTTTKIVERAGVSRGAQVHHFPTKSELVSEAVRYLAEKRSVEMRGELDKIRASGELTEEDSLDLLWRMHREPLYAASVELFVAARTDTDLRAHLSEVEHEVTRSIHEAATDFFRNVSDQDALREWFDLTLATMRGLALLEFVDDRASEWRWSRARRQLMRLFEDVKNS
jgi:AcrR family transcriptional regulator